MVRKKVYIPDRGDIVWVNFNPTKGHEQANKRPAIILSPKIYNTKTSLALACPITSVKKGYPFEIALTKEKTTGVVLVDQVRSIDWRERKLLFKEKASSEVLIKTTEMICLIIKGD